MYIKYIYMQHVTMCSEVHNCKYCYVLLYSGDLQRGDFRFRQCENLLVTAGGTPRSCSPWRPTLHQRRPPQCAGREGMAAHVMSLALRASHMGGVDRRPAERILPHPIQVLQVLQVSDLPIKGINNNRKKWYCSVLHMNTITAYSHTCKTVKQGWYYCAQQQ